jgi:hypothetical protein
MVRAHGPANPRRSAASLAISHGTLDQRAVGDFRGAAGPAHPSASTGGRARHARGPGVRQPCFDFLDTRVLGIPWPGFRNFPELNLRFYVRRGTERGVVFVREFVPRRFVAWMARTLYNEPYVATKMHSSVVDEPESIQVEHHLTFAGRTHTMRAVGTKPAITPGPESVEAFFKEHHWWYGRTRGGRTLRYHVWHPVWAVYPVREAHLDLDWGAVYGPEWSVMQGATPASTVLAVGSAIAVYPKGRSARAVAFAS